MSDSLALNSSPLPNQAKAKPALHTRFATAVKMALESLVVAHSKRFDNNNQAFYRFPPF
jgi:hypothetical protein